MLINYQEIFLFITKHQFKRIGLQIGDHFLHQAFDILKALEGFFSEADAPTFFVLSDSNFGSSAHQLFSAGASCCIDEITAFHNHCDCIIHFGYYCYSKSSRISYYIVSGEVQFKLSIEASVEKIVSLVKTSSWGITNVKIVIVFDNRFFYALTKILSILEKEDNFTLVQFKLEENYSLKVARSPRTSEVNLNGQIFEKAEVEDSNLFIFIGCEDNDIVRYTLEFSNKLIIAYNPCEDQLHSFNFPFLPSTIPEFTVSKMISSRIFYIEKAKTAEIFGIIVMSPSSREVLPLLKVLRELLSSQRKSFYTFFMNTINPQKLANFPNIEIFVLLACPYKAMVDARRNGFFAPIITPMELEIALGTRPLCAQLISDLSRFTPNVELAAQQRQIKNGKHVSLEYETNQIVQKNKGEITSLLNSSAAEFLKTQTFRGLEFAAVAENRPSKATLGKTGIAAELRPVEANNVLETDHFT